MQPIIDLVYFNAGGGHRAATLALQQAMQDRPWQVRPVNLVQMLDPHERFFKALGRQPEDVYNALLTRGLTLGMAQELKLLQMAIQLAHRTLVKRLQSHWRQTRPDLVVSLIPNFNRAMAEALELARPRAPFVTVLTDMADHPPHFWIEPETQQHLVCGTDHALAQARAAGVPDERLHASSGMILSPRFYHFKPIDPASERRLQGLPPDAAVGLVMFGGFGSAVMTRIAQRLPDVPLILICGKNRALAQQLRTLPAQAPRVVVEFTDDVAYWMQLADFFIGKPGPASLSEAVHMGLPVIVTRNAWTMPQERWNTEWVKHQGLGVVHRSFRSIRRAVDEMLADLPARQARCRAVRNQAVWELAPILDRLLPAPRGADAQASPDLAV